MNTTTDQLDDILERAGADFGKPEKRRERAVRLTNEGMTTATLDELVEFARTKCRRLYKIGTWVCWATKDAAQWQACVQQLHRMRADQAMAAKVPVAVERVKTPDELALYRRGMAYARVAVDRADPIVVAMELGISVATLDELVEDEKRRRRRVAEERQAAARVKARVGNDEDSSIW